MLSISHRMLERRHNPSKNKTLPLTCCLVGVMNFLEQKVNGEKQKNDWSKQPNPEALKQLLILHLPSDDT